LAQVEGCAVAPVAMAPIALEGSNKIDAASREVFDAFSACFSKLNGRTVDTFQAHEMLMLTNNSCFFDLVEKLRLEIETLTGKPVAKPVENVDGVLALAESRGLHLESEASADAFSDNIFRLECLGELLSDLQACRMVSKKMTTSELRLELSDNVGTELAKLVDETAQAFGIRVGAKAAGKGKGKSGGDAKTQALDQVADAVSEDKELCATVPSNLLHPAWKLTSTQEGSVKQIIELLNKEYSARRKVLTRRLDVTIQAFLWSSKADAQMEMMSQAIAAVMDWRDHMGEASIGLWDILAADQVALQGKTVSKFSLKSVVKSVVIGAVPDRGGVPEGYTVEHIRKDIVKVNIALTARDSGCKGGKGASAELAAASVMKMRDWSP